MKVGIFSDGVSQDFEYALEVIKELRVRYVELRSMWGKNLMDLSSNELKRVKKLIEKKSLKVSDIASPVFKCHLREEGKDKPTGDTHLFQEENYTEHLKTLEHSFLLAKMFGTNIVRVFSFWREGDLTEEILEEIVERFKVPTRRAEEENVILALENEFSCSIRTGKEVRQFLDRISSRNLGVAWDPGGAYMGGEMPYSYGYNLIKDRIVHVHIKGVGKDEKGKHIRQPIGKGEVDYQAQIQALKEDNYQGVISLENHYIPKSGSVEDGTRESFATLRSILESLGSEYEKGNEI